MLTASSELQKGPMSTRFSGGTGLLFALMTAVASLFVVVPVASAGFSAPTQFGVGTGPETITVGDLNDDGNLDMVTPNSSLGNVSVLLGAGDGSFAAKTDFNVGIAPTSVAIAELDPGVDSRPDLVVTNSMDDTVSIIYGNGSGSFSGLNNVSVGDYPVAVKAGDLNGDPVTDLVVANQNSGNVTILIGQGDGTFVSTPISTGGARSVAIGDLNNDGDNDLAVASSGSGKATVLIGDGSGQFAAPVSFEAGNSPFSIAIGDLDGDGFADLAVANNQYDGTPLAVLLNDGTGNFGPATKYATGRFPRTVAIGNLVGDSALDLVVANSGSYLEPETRVSVYTGDGEGGFATKVDYPAGTDPSGVAIGDLDSDQNLDLAVSGTNKASVLLNLAPAATASPASLTFPGQALNTTSVESTVTVTNSSGGDPLDIDGYTIDGDDAGDFEVSSEDCTSASVLLDDDCVVGVAFTPTDLGARNATLNVTYNGGGSPLMVPLTGAGLDTTPPDTIIDSGPSGTIDTDSATFAFHGESAGDTAKIMCSMDSAAFAECVSPKAFSSLTEGNHTVAFRAQDSSGNQDPTPATRTFTVDTSGPPALGAKIAKVMVKGAAKLKQGKKAVYTVKVTNSGGAIASGVKLKVTGKGTGLKKTIGQVAAGKSKAVKIKLGFKKPGTVNAAFKVTSSNAGAKTVKKKIKVSK